MRPRVFSYMGWLAVAVAVFLWCGFAWFIWKVQQERAAFSSAQVALAQMEEGENAAAKLHATMRETREARESLDALARTDVLSAVDMIEKVGTRVGAKVHVQGATAGSLTNNKTSKDIHAFLISATSEGKLQSMMRVVSLLEVLPITTLLNSIELQQLPADPGKSSSDIWRLTVRIRIITTSPIGA